MSSQAPSGGTRFATYPSLRDRVVVVTGGASGIGESLVRAFAAQHAQVVLLDVADTAAETLVDSVAGAGFPRPLYRHCDLADTDALSRTTTALLGQFPVIDALINNAGDDTRHAVEEVTPALWDRLMAINLRQQFFCTQQLLPGLRRSGHGSVVNLSSISWVIPSTGLPVYVAAKAAIAGLTRTLAHELGTDNIRVNCVMPGAIRTERQERLWLTEEYKAHILGVQALKRLLEPEEVARLVLFLAADDSSAITNQTHIIDGGWV